MGKAIKMIKIFNFMAVARLKTFGKKGGDNQDQDFHYKVVHNWAKYTIKTVGVNIETEGLHNIPTGNCLFVANHQSYLDIPIILSQINKPIGFIAKKQLEKIPLMSFWMKKIHCIFLNRESVREAVESMNEGAKTLETLCSMVIFPEGTRSKGDNIGDFKKGSMKLALKASVPIVPITICGSYKGYEENNRFSKADIKLIIGKPIYPELLTKEQKKSLSEDVRAEIKNNYKTK